MRSPTASSSATRPARSRSWTRRASPPNSMMALSSSPQGVRRAASSRAAGHYATGGAKRPQAERHYATGGAKRPRGWLSAESRRCAAGAMPRPPLTSCDHVTGGTSNPSIFAEAAANRLTPSASHRKADAGDSRSPWSTHGRRVLTRAEERHVDVAAQSADRFVDRDRARLLQLVRGESSGQHRDRGYAGAPRRLDIPRRIPHHDGVLGPELR